MRIEYLADDRGTIREVASWLYGEWGHLSPGTTLEIAVKRITQRAGRRTIPLTLVARENRFPVGTASLTAHDLRTRMDLTPWLASVYVLPSFRGRGLGAALCRRAVHEGRRLGFRRIYLFTQDKAEFYKRLGWKTIQRMEYRKQTVTIMAYGSAGSPARKH